MDAEIDVSIGEVHDQPVGAGILPFMRRPGPNGPSVRLLLGQEEYRCDWNQGGCWYAFEGRVQGGEDMYSNAAREFVEETMGSVQINGSTCPDTIAQSLRDGEYTLSICVTNGGAPVDKSVRCHVTFLVEVPWDDDVAVRFMQTRMPIAKLQTACSAVATARERSAAGDSPRRQRAAVRRTWDLFDALPREMRTHPAIVTHTQDGERRIALRCEHMEKRSIELYAPTELCELFHNPVTRHRIRLRLRFVPVLKAVLQVIPELCM